ncbi:MULTISPECIES: hypothetical protein [Bacillus cereus group]|uniref:hypothetical protein n=1 Tax=Bacillus cereus group TaxID=86661 RepID=UPI0007B6B0EB|nr:hypothetical protein [Bacillus cereus]ANC07830.1 hypothetical protein WR47_12235 [Bacillus cereus]ANC13652.1 hypothetical protein WR51_12245 [Bacillus cereus]MDA1995307.1 hypothetical protein [Bacillus cereus]MDA2001285.1 hypothetical protein [Bacillus cereus]MDA3655117.1 hypothetical protein [Bacillus cereus]
MQKPFYSKWWFWGIVALVIIAVVGGKNSGQKGQQFYTIMYSWNGEQGFGANANFMFQEDKLQNKAHFGLQ